MYLFPSPKKAVINKGKSISLKNKSYRIRLENCGRNSLTGICHEEIKRLFSGSGRTAQNPITFCLQVKLNLLADDTGQAYVVKNDCSGNIYITGSSCQGILYGLQTLKQIYEKTKPSLPECEISDWPDFRYRLSANWLHSCEISRWGYDRGQGIDGFIKEGKKRIDWALRYKINMIHFDFSYGDFRMEPFPGFSEIALELNRYARARGMKLMSGGLLSFGMKNRTRYPNGKVYECIGREYHEGQKDSFIGAWCFSNQEAWKIKARRLKDYVKAVEPGALYLHSIDVESYPKATETWRHRCDKCRKRWPDDRIESLEGMAGAYVEVQNRLCEAVSSVKNGTSGYDGSRDCLINLVTSPYVYYWEDDKSWKGDLKFYETLSQGLEYVKNVQFVIREQGFRKEQNVLRVKELAGRIKKNGKGHGIFVAVFLGPPGGGQSSWPPPGVSFYREVVAIPALYDTLDGAKTVVSFEASADREVNMILSAGYSWNSRPEHFYEEPSNYREWTNIYNGSFTGHYHPNEIYGKNGMVSVICRSIYGEEAGRYIAQALALRLIHSSGVEMVPLYHIESLIFGRRNWSPGLPNDQIKDWAIYWRTTKILSLEALSLLKKGRSQKDFNQEYADDIDWKIKTMELGLLILDFLRLESEMCLEEDRWKFNEGIEECRGALQEAKSFIVCNFPSDKKQFFQLTDTQSSEDACTPRDNMIFPGNGRLSNMRLWLEMIEGFGEELREVQSIPEVKKEETIIS